jgi:ABC-2 type transport system permease protein
MNAITLQLSPELPRSSMPIRRILRAYLSEARYESVRMLRAPSFGALLLSLPVLLYLLFAVIVAGDALRADARAATGLFTGFAVFGIMGPAMFGFGVSISIEREKGLLKLKRALPMPPPAYLLAKMLMSMLFATIVMLTMTAAGLALGHVALSARQALAISAVDIVGVLPFCAIGLFLGTLVKGAAAPGLTNLVYLPMIYLSGLFFPLPKFLGAIAPVWPAYHLNRLALSASGLGDGQEMIHVGVLAAVGLLFCWLAVRRLSRVG